MGFTKNRKLQKRISALLAVVMAVMLAVPAGLSFGTGAAFAADDEKQPADGSTVYDFRDGSIIPTDTDGKSDVSYGNLTVRVGTQNAYSYNGAQHGVQFKPGNTLELAVSGPSKITVGGCQYTGSSRITAVSADGSYSEEKEAKTAACYHQDESAIVFKYTGEAATTITIGGFDNSIYIPVLIVEPLTEEVPDDNGTVKDSVFVYNFADGSVVPASYDSEHPLNGALTSSDSFLAINGAGDLYMHDTQHGLALFNGNSFEVKVAGDATVTFNLCQYGGDPAGMIVASSKKGTFTSDTKQPLMDGKADGLSSVSFKYEGVATTLKFTVSSVEGSEM